MTAKFPTLRAEWDATQAERSRLNALLDAARCPESLAAYDTLHADLRRRYRDAFHEDTKALNSRAACDTLTMHELQRYALLDTRTRV